MGKTKKRYPASRILALILAVAMSVTMIPQTALAAPADDPATENLVNDIATEGGDDADANKGTGSDEADTNTDIDSSNADTGKNTGSDEVDGNKGDDGGMAEVNADDNTPAEKPVYEINIDGLETKPVYTGYAPFNLDRVVLKKTENGSAETVSDTVTHSWKVKGEDGNFTALAGEPVNAGEYELTLSYPAVPDVHDGANQVVACEIKQAPLTITVSATAKLGVKAVKENVNVVVESVATVTADQGVLTESVIALEVTGIRDAYGSSLKAEDVLKKNGDYVVDVTPSLKADASEAAKAAAKNYKLEPFAADVEMGDLTQTQIVVTLADQWKEEHAVTLHVYDGKPAKVPALTTDYTYEVQYWDDTAPAGWKKLEGAVAVGEWEKYEGCNTKEDGTVEAPTDAAAYTYKLTYEDKNGVYDSCSADMTVVINPAPVTVEITTKAPIKTTAGTSMTKVLSQVAYTAKAKDRDNKDVTIDPKGNHIWGTGYNDANVSQIYEPVFMLQVKEGQTWQSIYDADYRMEGGKEYRVIYDGKKAIYNADGTYAHRTGINSGLDEDGEEINGVSSNYVTDETPTADDKALTVEVQAGVEVEWDLSALLNDKKAGETPETAGAKDFDNVPLYANKSDYKNKVKIKGVTEKNKSLTAIGDDFTYTWYQNDAEDLLDKEILDQNKANGFTSYGFEDGWNELGNIVAPTDAGIYKLKIEYEDHTDDGTLYYVKDEKPAEVYFVINKVQLAITPEGEYSTLSGRTIWDFLNDKDNKISYKMLDKDGKAYTAPAGLTLAPFWSIIEETKQDGTNQFVETNRYTVYDDEFTFVNDANIRYKIQAQRCVDEDGNDLSNNYTLNSANKAETGTANASGQKRLVREEQLLGGTADLTVKQMGTIPLNITPKATLAAYEKTYDGKALTVAAVKPKDAYTLTKTENGQQVPVEDPGVQYLCVNKTDPSDECMLEDLRAAGEYNLYACFWGNETYAPLDLGPEPVTVPGVLIGTVTIKKCPISLSLKVDDTYEAGRLTSTLWTDMADYKVTGYVQNEECDDAWAFSSENEDSVWDVRFLVYEKGSKTPFRSDIFHRNKEFEIRYDAENSALDSWYDRNYEVTTTTADALCAFKTVAAPAGISSVSLGAVKRLAMADPTVNRDTNGNITQIVNLQEGIGYATYNQNGIKMTGNLAAFRIYAPAEFGGQIPDTAMYQNAVENAGGRVVSSYTNTNSFVVLFDAKKGAKTFSIRWEDKYVETITLNFDEKQCLGNLQDAVAPKSLAFNAAPKKLAVGSSVQLDVKITKAQMGDVICLGYKSSDESVMHVNPETGYVTALQKGKKATITVYPQHMDENGDVVEIKGAKTASVTIEGTAVTAPKPVKVTAHSNNAIVDYSTVSDGYRREIYVVDNKDNPSLKKAAAIEAKVKELQGNKNQWRGTFAIAPIYLDSADESYNRFNNGFTAELSGLQADRPYTVYVRNVCEAKTLADGYVITQSTVDAGAAGTAVSFKSLKSEVIRLDLKLDETVDGIRDVTDYNSDKVPAFYSSTRTYVVDFSKLAKKGLDSKTIGRFYLNAKDAAADSTDYLDRELPLKDKQDKAVYENPKLEYFVYTYDKNGNQVSAKKNEFVSVDNKGKIKLTGITGWYDEEYDRYRDYVTIYVRDSNSGRSTSIRLIINADVDSVTAKKKTVNLTVGQEVNLNDIALYNYKAGSSKLTSYNGPDMDMIAVREAVRAQKEYFELDGTTLRAIKGGGRLELSLTDKNVKKVAKKETDATAKITFVSKDLAPVKKIKGIDITNDKFGLTFTSAGYPDAFRVEITDSSKKKIYDRRYEICGDNHEDDEEYRVHELWQVTGGRNRRVKDAYIIDSWEIKRHVKLAKESQYTVTITALYDGVSSKPATGKVKTTKIPAQDGYLEDEYDFDDYNDPDKVTGVRQPRGGMSIQVSEGNMRLHDWEEDEYGDPVYPVTSLRVLSGNSYTLTANPSNRGRVNDTLVWTIGDKKVASVKAAAGTYCITLKGLKPGSTVLEVKSKILGNKVIARYDIYVVAVGDAYYNGDQDSNIRYYGDDEPEDWSEPSYPGGTGNNAPDYLPLSVGDPRKVGASQYSTYTYFSFTAPETGRYGIQSTGSSSFYKKTSKGTNKYSGWNERIYNDLGWLTEGETVYLRAPGGGAYYVTINLTQRMESAENGKTVTGQGQPASFEFKAPESGQYQFSLSYGSNQKQTLYLYTDVQAAMNQSSTSNYGSIVESWLEEGDSVWLTTRYNVLNSGVEYTLNAKKVSEDVTFGTPKQVTLAAGEAAYLMYTIAKSGYYRFFAEADTVSSDVSGEITVGGEVKASVSGTNFDEKLELNQGDVVCVKVTNSPYAGADVTFTVKTEDITPSDLSTVTGDVTIPNGSDTLYQFTAQAAGVYQFTMTVDSTSASDAALNIWDSISDVENYGSPLATGTAGSDESGKTTILAEILLAAGQTVYVNPVNNTGSDLTVGVTGAKDSSISEITAAGVNIELTASQPVKATFTAGSTGFYTFTTDSLSGDVTFAFSGNNYGSPEAEIVNSGFELSKKKLLLQGQTVMWTMTASDAVTVSFKAELTAEKAAIRELKLGQSMQVSLSSGEADGAVFTVPEAGSYTFYSEGSEDTYGILYDIDSVDADTCLLQNNLYGEGSLGSADGNGPSGGHNFAIQKSLTKGQTVYLKSMCYYDDQSISFTVSVGKGSQPWNN